MDIKEQNISAITLTFESKDFTDESKLNIDKFKEAVKTLYIFRINVPIDCYQQYYDSEFYKSIRDNTDKKTKIKFYLIVEKMNGTKLEQDKLYFDSPTAY